MCFLERGSQCDNVIVYKLSLVVWQLYVLVWDCCMMDQQFVRSCSEFYITQAVWLMMQLKKVPQSSSPAVC